MNKLQDKLPIGISNQQKIGQDDRSTGSSKNGYHHKDILSSRNKESKKNNQKNIFQTFRLTPYLDEQAIQNLKIYKYAGGDDGIIYKYFYNPFCNWLVQKIPEWIAPNLITFVGFLFVIVPFLMQFTFFGTHLKNEEPFMPRTNSYFFYFSAFSYFMYRMLDELDGKQARRTGNSSPLGLLFDHGCDSFSVGLQMVMIVKQLELGDSLNTWCCVIGSCSIFHFTTLEEYYNGIMILPLGNFITDQSVSLILGLIFLGVFGNDAYRFKIFKANALYEGQKELDSLDIFAIIAPFIMILNCFFNVRNIINHNKKKIQQTKDGDVINENESGHKLLFPLFLQQMFVYFFSMITIFGLGYIGEKPILYYPTKDGQMSSLFLLINLQCLLFQNLTMQIMICHVTKQDYFPLRNKLNTFIVTFSLILIGMFKISPIFYYQHINIEYCIYLMLFIIIVVQSHYILNVILEMATALNVRVFRVKDKIEAGVLKEKLLSQGLIEK